jgi:uncharacterized protein
MRLTEIAYSGATPIDGYGPGFFRLGGAVHLGGVLLLPAGLSAWSGYDETAAILEAGAGIDVLILGTGSEIAAPPAPFRAALEGAAFGHEIMATPTACRAYNMLLAEGRRAGAALLPMP